MRVRRQCEENEHGHQQVFRYAKDVSQCHFGSGGAAGAWSDTVVHARMLLVVVCCGGGGGVLCSLVYVCVLAPMCLLITTADVVDVAAADAAASHAQVCVRDTKNKRAFRAAHETLQVSRSRVTHKHTHIHTHKRRATAATTRSRLLSTSFEH